MKKNVAVINIPEIQSSIKKKHKSFLKDVGVFSHMLSDDHQLMITRLSSRISRVLDCFVEEEIITEVVPIAAEYGYTGKDVRSFRLTKNGFSVAVAVTTDGETILISKCPFILRFGSSFEDTSSVVISGVDVDKFDGVDFANKLLDFIQKTIYMRKESYEKRLRNDFIQEK